MSGDTLAQLKADKKTAESKPRVKGMRDKMVYPLGIPLDETESSQGDRSTEA